MHSNASHGWCRSGRLRTQGAHRVCVSASPCFGLCVGFAASRVNVSYGGIEYQSPSDDEIGQFMCYCTAGI